MLAPGAGTVEQVSGVLIRLNLATRPFHADVDEPWLDLLRPMVAVSDYLSVLVRTYGLIAPFESACKYTPGLARLVDFKQLMRAGLIAQDLLALGLSPGQVATIATCPSIAMFRSIPEALGWLYVVERSTLLCDGIRRHLLRHHGHLESACSYLTVYEGHVSDHWNAFGRVLDRAGQHPAAANEIIRAACDAFDTSRQWLRAGSQLHRSVG